MLMQGRYTDYIPGWDCHGLPIELAVDRELGKELAARSSKLRELDKLTIRRACRAARREVHRHPARRDEAASAFSPAGKPPTAPWLSAMRLRSVRELARVVRTGAVYRGKKPVFWCWNDRTALAEAEIEYQDDPGPSVYVGFAADDSTRRRPRARARPALANWTKNALRDLDHDPVDAAGQSRHRRQPRPRLSRLRPARR